MQAVKQMPELFHCDRNLTRCTSCCRYYGESMPFEVPDNATQLPTEQYKWLTIEQVIEDNSAVVAAVRRQMRVPDKVPAMAIGGSYGESEVLSGGSSHLLSSLHSLSSCSSAAGTTKASFTRNLP
jgi:hypothetical protein